MRVDIAPAFRLQPDADAARRIIESCVHCGFCTAVCPTYDLLDHELDSPRGRIYLIREMLQGASVSARTRAHLDRCLVCRACETACPSGVQYGHLIDIGRREVERRAPRSFLQRAARRALRFALTRPRLLGPALQIAWAMRPVLPQALRRLVPQRPTAATLPLRGPARKRRVLALKGCVQPLLAPAHDMALARVLDGLGVDLVSLKSTGCCGALDQHLGAHGAAAEAMRRNIDAWWPLIEDGVEAIVPTSSGCGAMVADYGYVLRDDRAYADKARAVSALLRDPAELIASLWGRQPALALRAVAEHTSRIAYHAPCTQQHALQVKGVVESLLRRAGYELVPVADGHLCCGSAGTYSILQPGIARRLRERKLARLRNHAPACIASANIGCILHLQQESPIPVRHWLELLADRLVTPSDGRERIAAVSGSSAGGERP